ncbi:hypothetical protein L0B53_06950 [Vibrio sp. SS-MA-C1-2]|uniref:hypothetical protein n=1 Tax=Vibrio sp. SS-MA-C1-2 TaxID=2908646 RepID=UPI001F244B63|nr:hypothetical protein [Vibrio sp. SS-MA-C1-2]UJF19304.1 hypothetical protein L0B53_06950 [Vibrio sp. SS-MA-C1-2]
MASTSQTVSLGMIILLLAGCSSSSNQQQQTQANHISNQAIPLTLSGHIHIDSLQAYFQPCDSDTHYGLQLTEAQQEHLRQRINTTMGSAPEIYTELIGDFTPSKNNHYVAAINVKHFNWLSNRENRGCQRPLHNFKAFGNEPFWSLVNDNQQTLSLKLLGEKSQPFELSEKLDLNRVEPLTPITIKADDLTVQLDAKACFDPMSGDQYRWQTVVTVDDKRFAGCAMPSNQDFSQKWVGKYFQQQNPQQKENVFTTLELKADHTAVTTYNYADNSQSVVEHGVWQQLTTNKISLLTTSYRNIDFVSERLFTINGKTLSTLHETINGKQYPIANGGLQLVAPE